MKGNTISLILTFFGHTQQLLARCNAYNHMMTSWTVFDLDFHNLKCSAQYLADFWSSWYVGRWSVDVLCGNKILIVCARWIGGLVTVIGRVADTVLCRACHIVVDWSMAVFVFYAFFYACTWNISYHQNKFKQKYFSSQTGKRYRRVMNITNLSCLITLGRDLRSNIWTYHL